MASPNDIARYAYAAGLRDTTKIAMAVSIALAESSGNTNAHNPKGRDDSYGLWQINMKAHTTAELGISSPEALFDPLTNARAMMKISKNGTDWSPWSTYPLRAAAFLPVGTTAAATIVGSVEITEAADATGVGALAQVVSETVQTPVRIAKWLTEPGSWIRVAYFALGAAMVIGGVVIFARPAVQQVASTAANVLPVGKAAKLIKGAGK